MEDSHGKDISLQCTTVKVPGMKPRGSRVVGAATAPPEMVTSELDALHLASTSTPGTTSTTNSSSSVNSAASATNTTPGRTSVIGVPKDKVRTLVCIYFDVHLLILMKFDCCYSRGENSGSTDFVDKIRIILWK